MTKIYRRGTLEMVIGNWHFACDVEAHFNTVVFSGLEGLSRLSLVEAEGAWI